MGNGGDHAGLRRHIDQIAAAGGLAPIERNQRAGRRLRPGPAVGLRLAHAQRHAVGLAGKRHRAARRHHLDIASAPAAARSGAPERRDGDHHQPRVTQAQRRRIEPAAAIECRRRQQADVGLGKQLLQLRPIGGGGRIEIEHALVDVDGTPVRAAAVGPGRIDLDHLAAEIGQDSPGEPAEAVGRIDDQDAREECHLTDRCAPASAPSRPCATWRSRYPWR